MDKYFGYSVADNEFFFNCDTISLVKLSLEHEQPKLRPKNWYIQVRFRDLTDEEINNPNLDYDIEITFTNGQEAREVFEYFNKYKKRKSLKVIK